jgi:predicted secreted protein
MYKRYDPYAFHKNKLEVFLVKVARVLVVLTLLLILAGSVAKIAEASENKLEGIVSDQNGSPISGVKVNIWDGKVLRQTVSDCTGKYSFSGITPGTFFAVRLTRQNSETVRMERLLFPEKENLLLTAEFLNLAVKSDFIVRVPSNPSTGYSWTALLNSPENILNFSKKAMEEQKKKAENENNTLGRGGYELWEFNTQKAGKASLLLGYYRSWEKPISPVRYHICSVVVK